MEMASEPSTGDGSGSSLRHRVTDTSNDDSTLAPTQPANQSLHNTGTAGGGGQEGSYKEGDSNRQDGSSKEGESSGQVESSKEEESTGQVGAPCGPSLRARLAGFRDMFFKSLRVSVLVAMSEDEWEYTEEPHVTRRQLILAAHPEIKQLMG